MCECVFTHVCHRAWKSKDNLWKLVLPFYHMGPQGHQTWWPELLSTGPSHYNQDIVVSQEKATFKRAREAGLAEGEAKTKKSPQFTHRSSVAGRALQLLTLKHLLGGKAFIGVALGVDSSLWHVCLPTGTQAECSSICCREYS